ncbi:hypothetical protein LJR090_005687 [Bosea sp. LjRoot90]|uniref:hypothetical protein n=1 Tax=Bosea sp. LjRoot90 TaxID=3342342 RepID=UPI003ECCDB5C
MARFALIVEAGGRAVDDEGRDLHRTLEYRATTSIARLLPTGLLLIFIGLALLVLADASDKPSSWGHYLFIALAVAVGIGVVAVALRARYRPGKPLFALSPAGIDYRIPWVKQVLIPWHEVQAVEAADIVTKLFNPMSLFASGPTLLYRTSLHPDVTVIVVSRQFYETVLHVNSFLLRGPGWNGNFIPYGETVQVALHHELVAADRQQLRQAVRSRWLAFRDQTATGQVATTVPVTGPSRARPAGVAMGDDPRTLLRFQLLQIAVLLAGIAAAGANIAGLWQLDGQGAARQARAKTLEDRRDREVARKRMQEEAKQRAAEDKRRQEENEEVLRRAFGR